MKVKTPLVHQHSINISFATFIIKIGVGEIANIDAREF